MSPPSSTGINSRSVNCNAMETSYLELPTRRAVFVQLIYSSVPSRRHPKLHRIYGNRRNYQHEGGNHRRTTTGNEPTVVIGFSILPAPSKGAPCPRLIRSTTPSLTPQSANLRIVPRRQLPYAPQTMLTTGLPASSQSTRRSTKARVSHPSPTGTTPSSSSLASPPMRTPDIGTARFPF